MEKIISFDQLPTAVNQLSKKLENIEKLLLEKQHPENQPDQWFDLNDLIIYDPAKRTKATWYSIVSRGEVPYHKNGKNLVFLKSEIDEWLKAGRRKSNAELEAEADNYFSNKK